MYAIVEINGQQFKVQEGCKIFVNHLPKAEEGQTVEFDRVLLIDQDGAVSVGTPAVEGAKVVIISRDSWSMVPATTRTVCLLHR